MDPNSKSSELQTTDSQSQVTPDSSDSRPGNKKVRRARGEVTRLKILQATLRIIAANGLAAVTHRAVAKEAEVSLSLTTYYFKDLQELLLEAFAYHKNLLHDEIAGKASDLMCQMANYTDEQLADPQIRELLAGHLVEYMVDYVEGALANPEGCRVEMAFFFDLHLPEHFRRFAYEQRQRILASFVEFYARLGSATPEIDADVLAGTVQRLQYEALAVPDVFDNRRIRTEINRVLMALVRSDNP